MPYHIDDVGKKQNCTEKLEHISQALLQTVSLSVTENNFAILLFFFNWNRSIYTSWENTSFKTEKHDSIKFYCPLKENKYYKGK